MLRFQLLFIFGFTTLIAIFGAGTAFAVVVPEIPGPADINRIAPEQPEAPPLPPLSNEEILKGAVPTMPSTPIPEGAKNIQFTLRGFLFEHVTVFTTQQLQELYQPYVGKKVSLEIAWKIADALTNKYRQEGYFLSRAFVPAQEVSQGVVEIRAVEGFISDVAMVGDTPPTSRVISKAIDAIKAERPARILTLERELLLLGDLPGYSFQATMVPAPNTDASARIILMVQKTKGTTTLTTNNYGSRYIGPYEVSAAWSGSLLPLQQTDLSILSAPQLTTFDGKLYSLNGTQKAMLSTAAAVDVTGGYSTAVPGFVLKPFNITSQSDNGGIGLSYHWIRQRDENLSTRLSMDFRDSTIYVLGADTSRDRIRAANLGINYDKADTWAGHNYLDIELRQGLPIFGSSNADDPNLSKPGVHSDFAKMQVNYTRLQNITPQWSSSLIMSGQKASGTLYSSEDFGYGGSAIGRAYDTSEISGDEGLSGSLELHYLGLPQWLQTTFVPYGFYDIGKVWNLFPSVPAQISGASAGPGLSFQSASGLAGNFYIAEPLTKKIDLPLYSFNNRAPRYAFQLTDKF